jgi:membrane protein implicated in regulation of membrane protease activity
MFSFRSDKTGFFVTIVLLALLVAAVVLTVVFLALDAHLWVLKVIWTVWWVLCIVTVLVRVSVFRWQRRRDEQTRPQQQPSADGAAEEKRQGTARKDE